MKTLVQWYRKAACGLEFLAPVGDLGLRLWVAEVFWRAGLTKIQSMDSTVALFTYVYHVPLLSPEVAAYLGTAIEITVPVLLALGLAGRLSAGFLFIYNIIAVISYPGLSAGGLEHHQVWGLMLLVLTLRGPGALSLDRLLERFAPRAFGAAAGH